MQSFRNRRQSDEASLDKCLGDRCLAQEHLGSAAGATKRLHQPTLALFELKKTRTTGLYIALPTIQKNEVHFAVRVRG